MNRYNVGVKSLVWPLSYYQLYRVLAYEEAINLPRYTLPMGAKLLVATAEGLVDPRSFGADQYPTSRIYE